MNTDKSLGVLGSFGCVQGSNYIIYAIVIASSTWHLTSVSFIIGQPDGYRCSIPPNGTGEYTNSSLDGCHLLHVSQNTTEGNTTTTCSDGWEYESFHGETSIVTDLDLVCDKALLGSTLTSIHFGGCLLGSYVTGQISDIFGRRTTVLVSLLGVVLSGTGMSFSWNYGLIAALKFLNGCFIPGLVIVPYVLTIEMFPPIYRIRSHLGTGLFWFLGMFTVAPLAYILPDWRHLQLVTSLSYIPLIPLVWYSYESIRWLVQRGRIQDAEKILNRIAKSKSITRPGYSVLPRQDVKLTEVSSSTADKTSDEAASLDEKQDQDSLGDVSCKKSQRKKYTLIDLFRTRAMIVPTLIVFFSWFACSVIYYGFLLNATNLAGNKYLNYTLMTLVEVPCFIVNYFVTMRFGRRRPLIVDFLVGGVACIITGVIPLETADGTSLAVLKVVIALVGRFFATMAFDLIYLVTVEVFPTVLRNVATGSASMVGRVGGMVAPFIVFLNVIHSSIPFIVFGVMSLVAGLLILPLPETHNRSLPETLEDGANIAEKKAKDVVSANASERFKEHNNN